MSRSMVESEKVLDRRLVALGAVIVPGSLMSVLDTTIVNVATHTLGREFGTSISTIQWVLTGYMLAFTCVIPVAGWAMDRFGAKRIWIGALLLFIAGAALSGSAWSAESLIVFRILQGIAGGMIPPVGQAILARTAGPLQMGRVMSMVAVPTMLGSVAGPVIGGIIISSAGWRWIFLLNLPLGVVALVAAWRLLPSTSPEPAKRLDVRGLMLLSSGAAIFVYGMSEAGASGAVGSPRTLAGLGAGVVLVALYALHARARGKLALIDISLLRDRSFAAAAATNLMVAIALFGLLILLPLYWQIVRGESPFATGLLLAPQTLGAVIATPLAGRLTDRMGAGVVVPVGIVLGLVGTAIYTQVTADTPYPTVIAGLFLIGLGLGATATPLMAAAYVTLPYDAIPSVSSALHTIKRLGASIGTAGLAIFLQHMITTGVPQVGEAALGDLPPAARAQFAPGLAHAFGQTFWMAFALIAIGLVPALLLPRRRRSGP